MVVCGKLFQLGCPMDARMKQAPRRARAPSSRRELGRLGLVAVRAQGEDKGEAKGESDGEKPVERKSRGSRVRKDPVLRRKKVVEKRSAKTEGDAQFDAVNPVSLGRRARKEIDTAWRKFTRLGQFTSTSISEFEVERMVAGKEGLSDLVGMESTGFEVPEAIDTRVLVVGATGQIGRVVLNKLLLRGYTVRAMVQSLSPEVLENFPPSVELIKGDISVMSDAFEATRDCDKVICCARARTNLLAEITRVENEGVKNLVTAMLHHKNEQKTVGQAKQRTNKILLFKFQNHKNTAKFGDWQVNSPGKEGQQGENYANFGYMGSSALPKISTQLPTEEFKSFTFEGSNTDFAETHSPLTLPEGLSLKDCEGLVINCHGNGKKFAVVLYTEDKKGRHGYISEFGTLETGFCTRRVPFSAFTRLTADQPPLNLRDVKDFGLRYRSAWNKDDQEGVEVKESRNFRIKLDWVKALPSGPESDVILVSCSGDQFQGDEAEKERYLKPKRAGEAHLRNSGLGYTVIRPSSLINVPGGQKALLFDQGSRLSGSISSADVADVCIRCLHNGEARNKTFEVSNESDDSASEFELVVHFPDKSDYVTAAVQGLEKNTTSIGWIIPNSSKKDAKREEAKKNEDRKAYAEELQMKIKKARGLGQRLSTVFRRRSSTIAPAEVLKIQKRKEVHAVTPTSSGPERSAPSSPLPPLEIRRTQSEEGEGVAISQWRNSTRRTSGLRLVGLGQEFVYKDYLPYYVETQNRWETFDSVLKRGNKWIKDNQLSVLTLETLLIPAGNIPGREVSQEDKFISVEILRIWYDKNQTLQQSLRENKRELPKTLFSSHYFSKVSRGGCFG